MTGELLQLKQLEFKEWEKERDVQLRLKELELKEKELALQVKLKEVEVRPTGSSSIPQMHQLPLRLLLAST